MNEKDEPAAHIRVLAIGAGTRQTAQLTTTTDVAGHYCFESLAFGEYRVTADDPVAGYPALVASLYSDQPLPHALITREHPSADVNWQLPYKAAKLRLHVVDAQSGRPLPNVDYSVRARRRPEFRHTQGKGDADILLLLPPDEDVVLRVSAPGHREWHDDRAGGGFLNYASGSETSLTVPLEPSSP